jgi:hypothetical protein
LKLLGYVFLKFLKLAVKGVSVSGPCSDKDRLISEYGTVGGMRMGREMEALGESHL